MKVKDLVSLKGCYSAHDIGEKEVEVISTEDLANTLQRAWDVMPSHANLFPSLANSIMSKYLVINPRKE